MESPTTTETRPYRAIGENIYILRKRRGLTQRELAKRLGVQIDTIRRIERGFGGKIAVVDALARELGVELAALLRPIQVGGSGREE